MAEIGWTEPAIADLGLLQITSRLRALPLQSRLSNASLAMCANFKHTRRVAIALVSLGRERYRQIDEPPCRIFCRFDGTHVFVMHVMRTERLLRRSVLRQQKPQT